MHIVLLSGGSGKRLWPLSNDIRSKQFIPLFPADDKAFPSGEGVTPLGATDEVTTAPQPRTNLSMAQRVLAQIRAVDPEASVTIATARSQVSTLRAQLGADVALSVEPTRRDTFPAIALAIAYLYDVMGLAADEAVAVLPVDPYVGEEYFRAVAELTTLAARGAENIYLLGMEPTYPSAKYGYIVPDTAERVSTVASFREKPDEQAAADLIARGALWNGGVFALRIGYVLDRARELLGTASHAELTARYAELPKISFDYAVVEREKAIGVLRYGGEWLDIGTWNTLAGVMTEPLVGTGELVGCEDTQVINELDVPVLVMGARDMVVAASPEGILVADKAQSSYIKPYVEKICQPIHFAEKSWGSFRLIDVSPASLTIKVTLNAGHAMNYHSHEHRAEVWTVTYGTGYVIVDGTRTEVTAGSVIELPVGCRHLLAATTDMTVIEVQLGEAISVTDKVKHDLQA